MFGVVANLGILQRVGPVRGLNKFNFESQRLLGLTRFRILASLPVGLSQRNRLMDLVSKWRGLPSV